MGNDGSGQLEMHIAKRSRVRLEAPIFAFDIKAAGEAKHTVDDQNFSVVAQVEGGDPFWNQAWVEQRHAYSLFAEPSSNRRPRIVRSNCIDQNPNLDAAMIRLSKSIHEVLPATGAIENVGGKADRSLRAFNRLKHGRIGLDAVG